MLAITCAEIRTSQYAREGTGSPTGGMVCVPWPGAAASRATRVLSHASVAIQEARWSRLPRVAAATK